MGDQTRDLEAMRHIRIHDKPAPMEEIDSKESDEWCTPGWLASLLGWFDLDPCSNPRSNILAHTKYMLESGDNGLRDPWFGRVYVNPPYSDPFPWAHRAATYAHAHVLTSFVFLVKLDPSTEWYRALMSVGARQYPFRHRVKYEKPDRTLASPPWPAALIVWNEQLTRSVMEHVWSP